MKVIDIRHDGESNVKKALVRSERNEDIEVTSIRKSDRRPIHLNRKIVEQIVCISTQTGCAMLCKFCAVCKLMASRSIRNLTSTELREEISIGEEIHGFKVEEGILVSIMGMGEPTTNLIEIEKLVDGVTDEYSFAISTVGLEAKLKQFVDIFSSKRNYPHLQLSLHFSNDLARAKHMPSARSNSIFSLLKICEQYAQLTGDKVCMNYTLFKGINDSEKDIRQLANLVKGRPMYVKLSDANGWLSYQPTTSRRLARAQKILTEEGIDFKRFTSLGKNIGAGCGQATMSYQLPKAG